MNKTIITFKALTYDGKIVRRNITIENEFEVILAQKWHGIDLPPTSIEEQVMNQLDETDKSQIMADYDFDIILDYWPKKPRKKKGDELKEFMEYCQPIIDLNPSFKRPFEAIISECKDTLFGKGKSNKTKLDEVMKMYELIMKGTSGILDMVNKLLDKTLDRTKKIE
jgi:hypothetical protein